MNLRLLELKEAMKLGKQARAVPSGHIWSSSKDAKSTGASKKKPAGPSPPSLPTRGGSIGTGSRGGSASSTPRLATVSSPASSISAPPSMPAQCSSRPPPTTAINGPLSGPPFSLSRGTFNLTEPTPHGGASHADVGPYLQGARALHAEFFEEIEQFVYDEQEQKKAFQDEALEALTQRRPSTVDAAAAQPSHKACASTQRSVKTSEMSTSPEYKAPSSFPSDLQDQTTSEMQTVALPDPRWEAFTAGLRSATAFNYFDHLLAQLETPAMMLQASHASTQ